MSTEIALERRRRQQNVKIQDLSYICWPKDFNIPMYVGSKVADKSSTTETGIPDVCLEHRRGCPAVV